MRLLAVAALLWFAQTELLAQAFAPIATGEHAGGSSVTFARLEAKNRSRIFSDRPSPSGERFLYLDDHNAINGELSPEIEIEVGTRQITTVVNLFSTNRMWIPSEDEALVGTVRLRDSEGYQVGIKTTINLVQPLRVVIRRREPTK